MAQQTPGGKEKEDLLQPVFTSFVSVVCVCGKEQDKSLSTIGSRAFEDKPNLHDNYPDAGFYRFPIPIPPCATFTT